MLIAYNDQPERDSLDGNLPSTTVISYHYNLQKKNTIHTSTLIFMYIQIKIDPSKSKRHLKEKEAAASGLDNPVFEPPPLRLAGSKKSILASGGGAGSIAASKSLSKMKSSTTASNWSGEREPL